MLTLGRKIGQLIELNFPPGTVVILPDKVRHLDPQITVVVVDMLTAGRVELGIKAPGYVTIDRPESPNYSRRHIEINGNR